MVTHSIFIFKKVITMISETLKEHGIKKIVIIILLEDFFKNFIQMNLINEFGDNNFESNPWAR